MAIDVDKKQKEYFTLKIPKPQNIERIFYILIIVVLLFFLFVYNPFPQLTCKACSASSDLTAAAVDNEATEATQTETQDTADDAAAATDDASDDTAAEDTATEDTSTDTADEEEEEEEEEEEATGISALEGEITYEVTDIVTEIKNKGTEYEFGKIKEVKFKIENNKEDIEDLKIYVYAYDIKSISDEISLVRGDAVYSIPVEVGQAKEGTIKLRTGSFSDLSIDKTVKVKFYDGSKHLKTKTEIIKIK